MDTNIDLSLLYIIGCFLLIYFVGKNTLFRKLDIILAQRHEMIQGARERAEGNEEYIETKMAEMNQALTEARQESFVKRQELRNQALDRQKEIVAEARDKAAGKIGEAQQRIDDAAEEARQQFKRESDELARQITERILRRSA